MKKIYKDLEQEQKERNVVFSSELQGGGIVHEVTNDEIESDRIYYHAKIKRLLDDSFFNDSPFKANIIRASENIKRIFNLE